MPRRASPRSLRTGACKPRSPSGATHPGHEQSCACADRASARAFVSFTPEPERTDRSREPPSTRRRRFAISRRATHCRFPRCRAASTTHASRLPVGASWYAPFILRPQRLGAHRVLIVLPTNTWQAYNFEDDGSWYENPDVHTVDLARPFIDGGVPPHYHGYDRGFIRWLALNHKAVDFLSDDDLDRIASGSRLAHAYDLIVFSGHEEYVTGHEYDLIAHYRDLGGNLAFLSANDIFYKVVKHGGLMDGRWRWRDLGRPEAGARRCAVRRLEPRRVPEPAVHRDRRTRRRGSSTAPGCTTATRSASTGSRSTRTRRARRPAPACSRTFPTSSAGQDRGDDVLHDPGRRQGLLGGRHELRRLGALAYRLDDAAEPLDGAEQAVKLAVVVCGLRPRRRRARRRLLGAVAPPRTDDPGVDRRPSSCRPRRRRGPRAPGVAWPTYGYDQARARAAAGLSSPAAVPAALDVPRTLASRVPAGRRIRPTFTSRTFRGD